MKNIISIKNLNDKCFENFNLDIKKNTYLTILGTRKSGKTTLSKLISKIEENNSVEFFDNPKIVCIYSPEDTPFVANMVYDELILSIIKDVENKDYEINKIVKELDIEYLLDKKIRNLNYSEKQILIVITSILMNPDILILDNILINIDPFYRYKVLEYLKKLNKEKKTTIINITEESEEVIYGREIAIINDGRLVINNKARKVLLKENIFIDNGFDLPFIVELSNKLKYYDLIENIALKNEVLVGQIWK